MEEIATIRISAHPGEEAVVEGWPSYQYPARDGDSFNTQPGQVWLLFKGPKGGHRFVLPLAPQEAEEIGQALQAAAEVARTTVKGADDGD